MAVGQVADGFAFNEARQSFDIPTFKDELKLRRITHICSLYLL